MTDKLLLSVRLPATQRSYEVRVPYALEVGQGAMLVARLLASREPLRFEAGEAASLMTLEGDGPGALLSPRSTFGDLVAAGELVDGMRVLLV